MEKDVLIPLPKEEASNTPALFLALFLLVLAFFILLVTISTLEEVKSKAVRDSLTSTFTSIVPPSTDPTNFRSREGDVISGQQILDELSDLFATALPLTRVELVHPGRLMRVRVKTSDLFLKGAKVVNDGQYELLDRLVAILSGRPPGLRFEMEFVIGTPAGPDGALPVRESIEVSRAGSFAREMIARGLPHDTVAVGVAEGNPEEVTFYFYIRAEEEKRLDLDLNLDLTPPGG